MLHAAVVDLEAVEAKAAERGDVAAVAREHVGAVAVGRVRAARAAVGVPPDRQPQRVPERDHRGQVGKLRLVDDGVARRVVVAAARAANVPSVVEPRVAVAEVAQRRWHAVDGARAARERDHRRLQSPLGRFSGRSCSKSESRAAA